MALSDAEWASEFEPIPRSNPPRPDRALNEAQIPMTGPGADSVVCAPSAGDGVFGGSHTPAGEAEPPRQPGRNDRARSIVVLLPALNEEMAVGSVISRIPTERLRRSGYDVRVWVVDGKSTDATLQVARERGANVYVQSGEGKGNGVRQALNHLLADPSDEAAAGSRLFVMLDADGSYPPEDIPGFVEALESGSDVVVGSRFRGRVEDGAMTSLNRLGNELLNGLARVLYRVPVSDVCTGMWAFREDCVREFGLAANSFDLEADLFASACEVGARMRELPVDYSRRIGDPKLVPLRTGLLIAWRLLTRRLNRGEEAVLPIPRSKFHFRGETA